MEYLRVINCVTTGRYADFTAFTAPEELPPCLSTCSNDTTANEHQCVSPEIENQGNVRLRFELHEQFRKSGNWLDSFDQRLQLYGMKIAQFFNLPLQELRGALVTWPTPYLPEPRGSPKLEKFLIARRDEPEFPGNRRLQDTWYVLVMAFRADSRRISTSSPATRAILQYDSFGLSQFLGTPVEVRNSEAVPQSQTNAVFMDYDFTAVFRFEGFEDNENPFEPPDPEENVAGKFDCHDPCHLVNEQLNAHRCTDDCDCRGSRTCNDFGFCSGTAGACSSSSINSNSAANLASATATLLERKEVVFVEEPISIPGYACGRGPTGFSGGGGALTFSDSLEACAASCNDAPTCKALEWTLPDQCLLLTSKQDEPDPELLGSYHLCVRTAGNIPTNPPPTPQPTTRPPPRVVDARNKLSSPCWYTIVAGVNLQGLGGTVASCVATNLTGDTCGEASCAVIGLVAKQVECEPDLCGDSTALAWWQQLCMDNAVAGIFAAAQGACTPGGAEGASTDAGRGAASTSQAIAIVSCVLVMLGCAGIVTRVMLLQRRKSVVAGIKVPAKAEAWGGSLTTQKSQTVGGPAEKERKRSRSTSSANGAASTASTGPSRSPEFGNWADGAGVAMGGGASTPHGSGTPVSASASRRTGAPPSPVGGGRRSKSTPQAWVGAGEDAPGPNAPRSKSRETPNLRTTAAEGGEESAGNGRTGAAEGLRGAANEGGVHRETSRRNTFDFKGGVPKEANGAHSAGVAGARQSSGSRPPNEAGGGASAQPFASAKAAAGRSGRGFTIGSAANRTKSEPAGPASRGRSASASAMDEDTSDPLSPEALTHRLTRLRQTADVAARRRFFMAQCLRWHPDKNVGDEARATKMFQLLQDKKAWFMAET
eukprot:CAMPEP_0117594330 /NCGR_PEP_ID=MMETSP0784-20121206/73144_1 /TAXON_ID=39447 /ORGANISM="" /LENGTH=880 /DNA_ID=CAMNT_0005396383 /DNA_START=62 /DNA_END=2704 /DNA_ORIENTATION=-